MRTTVKPQLRVMHVRVGEAPKIVRIAHSVEEMQRLVGGLLDCVALSDGVDIWCNDEALLVSEPKANRFVEETGQEIFGDFFLARRNEEGETLSLTDSDISKYAQIFKL